MNSDAQIMVQLPASQWNLLVNMLYDAPCAYRVSAPVIAALVAQLQSAPAAPVESDK